MSEHKRIMIIAHFCDYGKEQSNNRFNYLASMLQKEGFDVELVTSSFSHRDKKQRTVFVNSQENYKISLVYEPSYSKNISIKRLFFSHRIMAKNLKCYLKTCVQPDLIYCAIPSINVAEVASEYAVRNNIPFIIDVQDLWPEAYKLIIKSDLIYNMVTASMRRRIDKVYGVADYIIAVSETYAKRAQSVNTKCKDALSVFLGTDLSQFDDYSINQDAIYRKPKGEVWIVYCGTLGHSYDLKIIMSALKQIKDQGINGFRFIVIGSGPLEGQFKQIAENLSIPICFTGKLPYSKMCAQLKECDIAVNPIAKGAPQSIINKHADYAMAGLPVISTQENTEYQDLLKTYQCGINCAPQSIEQVASAIKDLIISNDERKTMGLRSRKMAEELFDRSVTYKRIIELIKCEVGEA